LGTPGLAPFGSHPDSCQCSVPLQDAHVQVVNIVQQMAKY